LSSPSDALTETASLLREALAVNPHPPDNEPIGLIGSGLVGTALAERLLSAGFDVVGYDLDPSRSAHLVSLGGRAVSSPEAIACQCRRVILSLLTTDVVCQVVEGEDGLLEAEARPQFVIDTTTGDPEAVAALAGRLAARGVQYLDATLSGSSQQIRDGKAVFMVGGEREAFEACRDVFDAVPGNAVCLGPAGSGTKAKLASNLILGLNRAALAEGLVFAERLGLELPAFLELLKCTPAYSAIMDTKGEKMLAGDFAPQARLAQHAKDVKLILNEAERVGQELPLSQVHHALLTSALNAGDGDLDNAAVIQEMRRRRCR